MIDKSCIGIDRMEGADISRNNFLSAEHNQTERVKMLPF
ncbi:lchAB domain protein [Bacillus atrophaeus]|nr:lchAB domain protein [Bacillus atrophaeus]